ncbi:olfactory receptor class A-like protein 1 [Lethenteron reissneri]|uniref:olfactory receptor class A-like protein 1 n=1 Tax=Lethenteron reissneri TaxID=7753 RepID=UPI002AB5EFA2|nr:olfactory receptor class A-like protein 1 [Lethenteron reissneri]
MLSPAFSPSHTHTHALSRSLSLCTASMLLTVLFVVLTVLGVCGNSAVLVAFSQLRRPSPADVVVIGMSATHLLSSVFKNTPYVLTSLDSLALGDGACKALLYSVNVLRSCSLAFTVILSALQLARVEPRGRPRRLSAALSRLLSGRRGGGAARLVGATCALCALASAPLLALDVRSRGDGRAGGFLHISGCVVTPSDGAAAFLEASNVLDVAALATLLAANALVLGFVLRHRRLVARNRGWVGGAGNAAALNAAKVIACLMVVAFVCWGVNVCMRFTVVQRLSAEWTSTQADVRAFFTSVYYSLSPFIIIFGRSSIRGKVARAVRRCPCVGPQRTRVLRLAVVDGGRGNRVWPGVAAC